MKEIRTPKGEPNKIFTVGEEQFAVGHNNNNKKASIFAKIDGKWTPMGPVCGSWAEANAMLKGLIRLHKEKGDGGSMIKLMQQIDSTFAQFKEDVKKEMDLEKEHKDVVTLPNPLKIAKSEEEAAKTMAENPDAEKFAVVSHYSGKARILAWIKDRYQPVGPEFNSKEEAFSGLQRLGLIADLGGRSLIEMIQRTDNDWKSSNSEPLSDIPDEEWVALYPYDVMVKESDQSEPQPVNRINFN